MSTPEQLPRCPLCGAATHKIDNDRAQCAQCNHVISISTRRKLDARRAFTDDPRQKGPI
jgi:hypothetical protein